MTTPEDPLRAAAQAVVKLADPDDDFDGQYISFLVPFEAIETLRAALAAPPVAGAEVSRPYDPDDAARWNAYMGRSAAPALDVERLTDVLADWTIPELDRLVEPGAARHYAAAIASEYAALAPLHPEEETS